MMRPARVWALFGVCFAVLLAALAWLSAQLIEHERLSSAENQTQQRVQLALWRMDSAVAPLIAVEGARPYFDYLPFYAANRPYEEMYAPLTPSDALVPSALLLATPEMIHLHFELRPDGSVASPQAPDPPLRVFAHQSGAQQEAMERADTLIDMFSARAAPALRARSFAETARAGDRDGAALRMEETTARARKGGSAETESRQRFSSQLQDGFTSLNNYAQRGILEQNRAQRLSNEDRAAPRLAISDSSSLGPFDFDVVDPPTGEAREGIMRAVWLGGELALVRTVRVKGDERVQGAWLDASAVRAYLLQEVDDLLPGATLAAVPEESAAARDRMLASLPFELRPGKATYDSLSLPASFFPLLIAWLAVLGVGGAVAALLHGVLSLSERRASFVSTVTHELRSPLTSIRLYADLLAENAITEDGARGRAVGTMRRESARLSRLLENVLSYARLEHRGPRAGTAPVAVGRIVERVEEAARERAAQAGMELEIDAPEEARAVRVLANEDAAEQILFNLVDNACKYAAGVEDKRVHLEARQTAGAVVLRVRDHGPGVGPKDAARLFRPFAKAAGEETNGAGGVGLGLALSRRLARSMGGDLRYDPHEPNNPHTPHAGAGAVFSLTLRRSPAAS